MFRSTFFFQFIMFNFIEDTGFYWYVPPSLVTVHYTCADQLGSCEFSVISLRCCDVKFCICKQRAGAFCRRVHRLLHTPKLYNAYHYIHHKYDPPFSLAGEIQHPVEFFFNIIIPLMAGPVLVALTSGIHGESACVRVVLSLMCY